MGTEDGMSAPDAYQQFIANAMRHGRSSETAGRRRSAEAAHALHGRFRELTEESVTGADGAGYVEATTRLGGELTDVRISALAMRNLNADELGVACTQAIAAARTRSGEVMAERLEEMTASTSTAGLEELIPQEIRRIPEIAELLKGLQR